MLQNTTVSLGSSLRSSQTCRPACYQCVTRVRRQTACTIYRERMPAIHKSSCRSDNNSCTATAVHHYVTGCTGRMHDNLRQERTFPITCACSLEHRAAGGDCIKYLTFACLDSSGEIPYVSNSSGFVRFRNAIAIKSEGVAAAAVCEPAIVMQASSRSETARRVLACRSVIMNFPEKAIVAGPRSFVSEKDIDEKRKKKQEEWERTRKPDDPEGELISLLCHRPADR